MALPRLDPTRWQLGPFVLDAAGHTLTRDGRAVAVAPAGIDVLRRLCEAGGRPLANVELGRGWPGGKASPATVRQAVTRLRRVLGPEVPIRSTADGWTLGVTPVVAADGGPVRVPVRAGVVDLVSRRLVRGDGRPTPLPELETRLLARLARSPGTTVTREQLLVDVWDAAPGAITRAVDTAIRRLRVRIEVDPSRPDHVIGARAAGYRFVPLSALRPGGSRLAAPLATRIARREDAELGLRLGMCRLVSVVGPPGVGKTTQARAWAAAHQEEFDQAWLAELAAADTELAAIARVAQAVGAGPGDPVAEVSRRLAGAGRALLVLDTTEHLPALGARVARWLDVAPGLTVLATGRCPLGVHGEGVIRLEPLGIRDAVRLFQLRCEEGGVPAGSPEDVRRLVDRLDGLPLAIELAAGRAEAMRPGELLARLDDPLVGLRDGGVAPDEGPSTLERAVARSWDLLAAADRTLLARLSLLPGSFSRADAALVDPATGEEQLARLARGSLLRVLHGDHTTRYTMLATIRAYAARFRDDATVLPEVAARLCARGCPHPDAVPLLEVLLGWATAAPGRRAPPLLGALADATDATADPASLRWIAAAERVADPDERVEVGLHAVVLLRRRGRLLEAERRVRATLALPGGATTTRALLHTHDAFFRIREGEVAAGLAAVDRAEALADTPVVVVTCRHLRASAALAVEDHRGALARFEEALALPGGTPRQTARLASAAVAVALALGDRDRARALIVLHAGSRGPRDLATWLYYQACLDIEDGRDDEALAGFDRVASVSGATGTATQRILVASMAAGIRLRQGHPALAAALLDAAAIDDPDAEPARRVEAAGMAALAAAALGDRSTADRRLAEARAAAVHSPVATHRILAAFEALLAGEPTVPAGAPPGQLYRFLQAYARGTPARPGDPAPVTGTSPRPR